MNITPEIKLAMHEAVDNSMGIYPQKNCGIDRTEWQNGWNAFSLEQSDKRCKVFDWFKSLPEWKQSMISEMLVADALLLQFDKETVDVYFLTSDLFAWGYANWDKIEDDEMLKILYSTWQRQGIEGMLAWWCKHEKEKPQWPVEELWRKSGVWDEELEALPDNKYDAKVRWKTQTRLEAVVDLLQKENHIGKPL